MDAELRGALRIEASERAGGGCIHECHRVRIAGTRRFLKLNSASFADAFAAEADGLRKLRAGGLAAPEPVCHGTVGTRAYLVMELLELTPQGNYAALGRMLALAHSRPGPAFGWGRDNYLGATPQPNPWSDDWAVFWREHRLAPQLALARKTGFDLDAGFLDGFLEGHRPQPSLLHGDLWSGNVGFTRGGPVVFDPAAYYGDREADVAMTELFGGFPAAFYEGYEAVLPLPRGYARRKHLYNLYHLLNHLNLFGGAYLEQVSSALGLLRNLLK